MSDNRLTAEHIAILRSNLNHTGRLLIPDPVVADALLIAAEERDSARAQLEAWQARQPLMLAVIEAARDVCRSAPDIITREVQWMRLAMAIDALDGEGTKEAE